MQRARFNLNEGLVDAQVRAGGCIYSITGVFFASNSFTEVTM